MAFFNEFPHTRTYDSDLAWLIKRMKEVLARMDSVEARMKALEDLVADFIASLDIEQAIKDALQQMIAEGVFDDLLTNLFNNYTAIIDQKIENIEQQLNTIVNDFITSANQRISAIESALTNYYTKTEIDNMLKPSVEKLFDESITWGTDVNWGTFGIRDMNVTGARFVIFKLPSNMVRLQLQISGTGNATTPESTSYSPEFSFGNAFKNRIAEIVLTNSNCLVSRNPSGFWNNSFTFDSNNKLNGVILVRSGQAWTPPFTATSLTIFTDNTFYNIK